MMTALFERISLQARQYPQLEAVVTTQTTLSYAELHIECRFQAA